MSTGQTAFEQMKGEVHRIGWRIQYRAKKLKRRELTFFDLERMYTDMNFTDRMENRVMVEQLINTLPQQGKLVIHRLYIQDLTETEVARELNISQQAVSRWKRRMISQLSQTVNS